MADLVAPWEMLPWLKAKMEAIFEVVAERNVFNLDKTSKPLLPYEFDRRPLNCNVIVLHIAHQSRSLPTELREFEILAAALLSHINNLSARICTPILGTV